MYAFHSTPLHLKFAQPENQRIGEFIGYASTFGGEPDSYRDIIAPGAFQESLSRHQAAGTRPAMLWQHDMQAPIGGWQSLKEDEHGLLVSGKLTLEVEKAKESYALMKDGALAMSIGFHIKEAEPAPGGNRLLTKIDLLEISLVAIPANPRAVITEVKSIDPSNPREFERRVRDALGLSAREAKRLLSGGWSALVRDERSDNSEELAIIASRLEAITKSLRVQ